MTTIINPPAASGSDSSVGMVLGLIVLLVVAGLFFVYVLPAIRSSGAAPSSGINVNVKLPTAITPQPAPAPQP